MKFVIFLLGKLSHTWDVFFTFIDNKQLKYWYLINKLAIWLESNYNGSKKNTKLEDHDSWEDIK